MERMRALTVPWVEGVVHVPLGSGLLPRVSRACGVGRWGMGTAIHTSTLRLRTVTLSSAGTRLQSPPGPTGSSVVSCAGGWPAEHPRRASLGRWPRPPLLEPGSPDQGRVLSQQCPWSVSTQEGKASGSGWLPLEGFNQRLPLINSVQPNKTLLLRHVFAHTATVAPWELRGRPGWDTRPPQSQPRCVGWGHSPRHSYLESVLG